MCIRDRAHGWSLVLASLRVTKVQGQSIDPISMTTTTAVMGPSLFVAAACVEPARCTLARGTLISRLAPRSHTVALFFAPGDLGDLSII